MNNDTVIKLTNVSKRYYLHSEKPTLVENLNPFSKRQVFWALNKINLTIKKGDRIGLIGPNGAGKTTLLKIIAGITKPTTGVVYKRGRIVSLIELTAGFQPEMSGINNIILNGILLGMTKQEVTSQLKKIIEYADIGQFINQPLYTYSDGMALRLGIAVLFHMKADIYVFDENLFVGDKDFTEKIYTSMDGFFKKKKTLIIASHSPYLIERLCTKTVLLEKQHVVSCSN